MFTLVNVFIAGGRGVVTQFHSANVQLQCVVTIKVHLIFHSQTWIVSLSNVNLCDAVIVGLRCYFDKNVLIFLHEVSQAVWKVLQLSASVAICTE